MEIQEGKAILFLIYNISEFGLFWRTTVVKLSITWWLRTSKGCRSFPGLFAVGGLDILYLTVRLQRQVR